MGVDEDKRGSMSGYPSGAQSLPGAVLVVDDDDALRVLVGKWLSKAGLTVVEARTGEEALEKAREMANALDAIVCDVMMPGLDGFEVVKRLKADPATSPIPIVLLTAHATAESDIVRGVESGAIDHLAKPFSGPVLVAKVRALCERARVERALRRKLRHAEENATVDALTGLFNRRHFEGRLKAEASHALRHRRAFALVIFDLDHFKSINDTFGHEEGDRVLKHVAEAIRASLRGDDQAFRYGGEEFVLLLRACDASSAAVASERLRDELRARPIDLGEKLERRVITFSAGIAAADASNGFNVADLLARADAALYRAKRGGRDRSELEPDSASPDPA